jgi:PAS domain S-box-containing protein
MGEANTADARLKAVIALGVELASERDPDRLLSRMCVGVRDLFGTTYVTLGVLHQSTGLVRRVETCGVEAARWLKIDDAVPGVLGSVVTEQRTMRGINVDGNPAKLGLPPRHPPIRAFLATAVTSAAHVKGWLCLVYNDGRAFTQEDEELVVALSGQMGLVYELAHELVERAKVESALRHEMKWAQRYLDAADVTLLALDGDERVTRINRKGCDLLGWTERELLGRDWIETCLPFRLQASVRRTFHDACHADPVVVESPVRTRSGTERRIAWRITALQDDEGHVVGTLSSGTDVTDRRHVEEAQRASEGRYRALFEYAPDGIVIADDESCYIDANPSVCRMLGYPHDELVGLHAADIVEKSEVEHVGPALSAIKATADYHREWRFRRKDGSRFTAEVIATVMPDRTILAMIRDITERNKAIEALRAAEQRMRFALENANVGIWDMDYTTGALRWSETSEAHYGLLPGTFAGTFEAFVERIHPDDRQSVLEEVGKAMNTGSDFYLQHRALWPDGTIRWLSGAGRVLRGENGEPVRAVGISQDITDRKHAEATLRQSESRKAAILDSVMDCIVTMDAQGRVIEFNASAERTFGYTKAYAIGRMLEDLIIPPRLRAAHSAGLARYLATGEGPLLGRVVEIRAMRADGSEVPVELAVTAIHSDSAPIFTGVLRDITSRQQADQTRARLAAIVDSSDDAIFSTGLDGTVLTWNAGAERLYGYTSAEAIGLNRELLVPDPRRAELTAIVNKMARREPGEPFETQRTRKDGSLIDLSLTISPMTDSTGQLTGASTIARDITSRKRAEAALRSLNEDVQRQRLRVFKATIRTVQDIVNNMLNSFQLIRLEAADQVPAETLALVDRMVHEANGKLQTLGDLETVTEKELSIGLGIDFPGSGF